MWPSESDTRLVIDVSQLFAQLLTIIRVRGPITRKLMTTTDTILLFLMKISPVNVSFSRCFLAVYLPFFRQNPQTPRSRNFW